MKKNILREIIEERRKNEIRTGRRMKKMETKM